MRQALRKANRSTCLFKRLLTLQHRSSPSRRQYSHDSDLRVIFPAEAQLRNSVEPPSSSRWALSLRVVSRKPANSLTCSFCGQRPDSSQRNFVGPGVLICVDCVTTSHKILDGSMTFGSCNAPVRCSFCGHSGTEVRGMIGGPGVYICDDCVTRDFQQIEPENNLLS
jgi:ClpX C4-type zinc finger